MSKVVFQVTKGLFLVNEDRPLFAEAGAATRQGLFLASEPHRLESERLYVRVERLRPGKAIRCASTSSLSLT
jgi:hypothetical protein